MRPLLVLAPLALAACGEAPEPEPSPTAEPTVAAPRTLVAADFDPEMLGARIVGPQGPEVESAIMADGRDIGRIASFVACDEEVAKCIPAEMPEGTVYTYVHELTLADDLEPAAAEAPAADGAVAQMPATLFAMTRAASGFNGSLGYSREQAEAALGQADAISVTSDQGRLIWRVTGGSGWQPGAAITFFWQSTVPPEGPAEAYRLETRGLTATVTAPFPPGDKPVEGDAAN